MAWAALDFEPVTSSVSGKSRVVPGVCHRRTESNWEPSTWEKNLAESCWVRGRLNTLAPHFWLPQRLERRKPFQAKIVEGFSCSMSARYLHY